MGMTQCAETYVDVEKLIYRICHNFQDRFGGDFEEHVSTANEAYMDAYATFDPAKGKFTTLLWTCVWRRLMDVSMTEARRQKTLTYNSELVESADRPGFDLGTFTRELSDDAKTVVNLLMDMPGELAEMVGCSRGVKIRKMLRKFLDDNWWTAKRISGSFKEIREALI